MNLAELLQPWNLIFLLPAVAAVGYLLLVMTGVTGGEDGDLDVDGASEGSPFDILGLIGVGRAPLSLILVAFGLLWGFLGWVGNLLFGALLGSAVVAVWPALVLALLGGVTLTRGVALGLNRLMPGTESYGLGNREFVGRIATVRYAVSEQSGTAQVVDERGTMYEVPVRTRPGEVSAPSGSKVILWRYDEANGAYLVVQDDAFSELRSGN